MENLEGSRMTLFTIYFVNWILRSLRILVASMIGLKERGEDFKLYLLKW